MQSIECPSSCSGLCCCCGVNGKAADGRQFEMVLRGQYYWQNACCISSGCVWMTARNVSSGRWQLLVSEFVVTTTTNWRRRCNDYSRQQRRLRGVPLAANTEQLHWWQQLLITTFSSVVIPRAHRAGVMQWWPFCLSVCLTVCPCLTISRERKGIASWKLVGGKPMTRWPVSHLEVKGSKVTDTRPIKAETTEMCHIFGTGRSTNFIRGLQMEHDEWPASPSCAVTSKVKGQD